MMQFGFLAKSGHAMQSRIADKTSEDNGKAGMDGGATALAETSLYVPVKTFLQAQGFVVKGEICGCDLVARNRGSRACSSSPSSSFPSPSS